MTSNAKESIGQSRVLVDLYTKRVQVLEQLATLDETISKVVVGQSLNGNGKQKGTTTVFAPKDSAKESQVPKRGRGRPKGSKNKKNGIVVPSAPPAPAPAPVAPVAEPTAVEAPSEGKRFRNFDKAGKRLSLREVIVRICSRHPTGIKLPELVKKCYDMGYRSTSDAKGFEQNIRTNLHTLMSKEIIVKDEEKRYHFQQQQDESQVEVESAK